jgi:hypothetical protein
MPQPGSSKEEFQEWSEKYEAKYSAAMKYVEKQLKPGATVTYPDGTRYKAPLRPRRSYVCEDTGERWNVYMLREET